MRNVPLFFCLMWSSASAWQRTFGYRSFPQHYSAISQRETEMFSHQVSDRAQGAMLTYSWIESGAHPADRYVGDNLIIRYYIDDERSPSLVFTPALAGGSGVGLEGQAYYMVNASDPHRGNCSERIKAPGPETCGQTVPKDLLDGYPWETKWIGKGGAEGSWISHIRVPFSRSLRITAQVPCGAPECSGFGIPPEWARADIGGHVGSGGYAIFQGIEADDVSTLKVSLGMGAVTFPGDFRNFRLRLQHQVTQPVSKGEFVVLANYSGGATEAGAVLLVTTVFDGMRGPLDIEGCWWMTDSPASSFQPGANSSDPRGPILLGTGTEDFFGNAFGLTWTTRLYHTDNAGLTHVRGGPNPDDGGHPGRTPGASFFSAYRFFDKAPLLFHGGTMAMVWRNGGRKCGLRGGDAVSPGPSAGGGSVRSLVWFYTY